MSKTPEEKRATEISKGAIVGTATGVGLLFTLVEEACKDFGK